MTIEPSPIRVLIVDDHTVVRFGLAAIIGLQPDMTVAGEAASAEEACALCEARPFMYEGYGAGRCNCEFTKTYPYAFGPRLASTYRLDDKTVLRAGWGVTYSALSNWWYVTGGSSTLGVGFNSINWTNPAFGEAALRLQDGLVYNVDDLYPASFDPGIRPSPGQLNVPPAWGAQINDPAGRPAGAREPVEHRHPARDRQAHRLRGGVRRQPRRLARSQQSGEPQRDAADAPPGARPRSEQPGRSHAADVADRFGARGVSRLQGAVRRAIRAARPSRRRCGRSRSSTTASPCAGRRSATRGTTRCNSTSPSANGTASA